MFTAESEDVLVSFQSLCEQYPRENVIALWEMAGGQVAAQQSFAPDSPYFCGECGTRANLPHHPRCSHFQSGGG